MVYLGDAPRTPTMRLPDRRPRRPARAALLGLLLCTLLPAGSARPAAPDADAAAFLARLEGAWQTRDLEGWLALWDFASPEQKAFEEDTVRTAFSSDETVLNFLRRPTPPEGAKRFGADVQVFAATEPRAQVSYWRLSAERRAAGWAIVSRQEAGQIDGLVHLSLGPRAWRARGVSLRLEDFELRMEDGTLFTTPETLGPTAFAFVGRARVHFSPAPPSEREQVRQFSGEPALDREVGWAFIRLHPADFHRALETGKLEPETDPGPRRAQAERVWRDRSQRSFTIDAPLPRSPWWLMPSPGDAVVDFPWGRKRVLTFALSAGEPEDVNLFDRDRRFQICTYPSGGRAPRYSEDDRRVVDVLDNDITARFDPERLEVRRHAHDAREAAVADPHAAPAAARRLPGRLGHHRGGRQPALLPRARPGQPGRLARPAGRAGGALHAHHALLGPPRPRPGRPGARAAHLRPPSRTPSSISARSSTRTGPRGTPARRTRTSPPPA